MTNEYKIPNLPLPYDLETKAVLKQLNLANKKLAELKGVEETSDDTIHLIKSISGLMAEYKIRLRRILGNKYKHDLLNNLFRHPYTKIEYVEKDMIVSRQTASKYLDMIVEDGLLTKTKLGKDNYYINDALYKLFINQGRE